MITNKLEYYNEITELSRNTWREALEQSDGELDAASDYLHETVSGLVNKHPWKTYDHYHSQVLRYSSNSDAYLGVYDSDALGDLVRDKGVSGLHSEMVYHAMVDDIFDHYYEFLASN